MDDEIWKEIDGFQGYYSVSNFGRIRSDRKIEEKILKQRCPISKKNFYVTFKIFSKKINKHISVKDVVAAAFLPEPEKKNMSVAHKDNNIKNNRADNLYYIENTKTKFIDIFNDEEKINILKSNLSFKQITSLLNISQKTIDTYKKKLKIYPSSFNIDENNSSEIWKPIPEIEGFVCSSKGRVVSLEKFITINGKKHLKKSCLLKPSLDFNYLIFRLCINKKRIALNLIKILMATFPEFSIDEINKINSEKIKEYIDSIDISMLTPDQINILKNKSFSDSKVQDLLDYCCNKHIISKWRKKLYAVNN